jgi:ubiquinone/menaquinone biosynthesis C-methylase UbiE
MKDIKDYVKAQYSKIVSQKSTNNEEDSCCSSSSCCQASFNETYENLNGYNPEADYGLGCGIPTQYAKIESGQTVLDLGSGAGNDCFVARAEVGESGKVYGLDFSETMVEKAKQNAHKLGYSNVEFLLGDIEEIPLKNNSIDVVVSNCVLNLIPNKDNVFSNIFKILKRGGHFSISDVVTTSAIPKEMKLNADLYSDCVSGATPKSEYLASIKKAGFKNIVIQKERELQIPKYANEQHDIPSDFKILSLTLYAEK